jgi:hypothetical protein
MDPERVLPSRGEVTVYGHIFKFDTTVEPISASVAALRYDGKLRTALSGLRTFNWLGSGVIS